MKNIELNKLLGNSLVDYYWLGFILADGHITTKRLKVVLSIKDTSHLLKLANYLNTTIKYESIHNYPYIDIANKKILTSLKEKYNIADNKTENPPDITSIVGDNLTALTIGFIDGDGNITKLFNRKDFHIRVKVHKSWLNVLIYMFGKSYINNAGYALSVISNTKEVKKWKSFALKYNLPILNRKWDIIDMEFVSKQELGQNNIIAVKKFLQNGISRKKMCDILGISKSGLSLLIKRNNLV